ncbi:ABC transporter ATP-binding protein [Vagococcus intermedius]|uniref:ABC transporter ATP-binding protein/permease n=1 Tax=Vagococcus intermedius TaxID=2991418 RepID=A0AAF0CUP3_9ENTE|nr:ABC transporter ATP-binding protein [Vagococcus intermedius]WEG73057.1 ABC transporter ATP-binding protein/permease [Vagococcus intermedius]WEG75141.1 ABC transporter ATP-binding protein/permease [Vagococcus intermedius]
MTSEETQGSVIEMLRFIFKRVWTQWPMLLLSLSSLLIIAGLEFSIPQVTQRIIDEVIPSKSVSQLSINIGLLLLFASLLSIFSYISTYVMSRISQTAIVELREDLYRHVLKQDFQFFETQKTGDLMTRFSGDIKTIQDLISPNTLKLVSNMLTFGFVMGFMLVKDWRLTLLISLTFPMLYLLNFYFSRHLRQAFRKVRQSTSKINNQLQASLTSILLIKNFATEDFETERFKKVNTENKENYLTAMGYQTMFAPSIDFVNYLGVAIVLGYGTLQVFQGELTVGNIIAYLAYLKLLQNPIRSFTQMVSRFQQSVVSYERIMELYEVEPTIIEPQQGLVLESLKEGAEFSGVSFGYQEDQVILDDVSFKLPEGEVTALVGSSGSGKTTVTRLLTRLYDPTSGQVLIDGKDIKNYTMSSLRHNIGIVSQDVELIDGSIRENILYGSLNATEEQLIQTIEAAKLTEFIEELPRGVETQVGERGIKLSGGQKQRIAIARVLLKDAPLLILDEATASLDNESERHIQMSLDNLLERKTSLVIAHRLSTIHNADTILVMDHGKIIEQGTHTELLSQNGRYASLYHSQFK